MAFRDKKRKKQKAERGEAELLRALLRLANQLQSNLALDAVVHVIATALSDTFGFREASVYLREDADEFAVHATVGEFPDYDRVLFERPVPGRIWDELFLEKHRIGSSYFVDHRRHEWTEEQLHYLPELDLGPRRDDEWGSGDDLFVPLYGKEREMVGVLDLFDPADRRLPTLDLVESLEVFAAHAAAAVENARRYEALEETSTQLEGQLALQHAILEVSGDLLAALEPRGVFARLAMLLKEIVDFDSLEVRLVDEKAGELYSGYSVDEVDGEAVRSWRTPSTRA